MKPPSTKFITLVLVGSLVFIPMNPKPVQAGVLGKVITKIAFTAAKKLTQNKPGKLPIVAGYKKGANPLPEGYKASTTYKNIWMSIKSDLGLK